MSTQLIGFSIGGIFMRFVVPPPSMIWPEHLVMAALFNTLHGQETWGTQARGGISRKRFFFYVFIGYILYSQYFLLPVGNLLLCCGSSFDYAQISCRPISSPLSRAFRGFAG